MNHGGQSPAIEQPNGFMEIGLAKVPTGVFVAIQFTDPDWWMHLTPTEARQMAHLLRRKADEAESEGS